MNKSPLMGISLMFLFPGFISAMASKEELASGHERRMRLIESHGLPAAAAMLDLRTQVHQALDKTVQDLHTQMDKDGVFLVDNDGASRDSMYPAQRYAEHLAVYDIQAPSRLEDDVKPIPSASVQHQRGRQDACPDTPVVERSKLLLSIEHDRTNQEESFFKQHRNNIMTTITLVLFVSGVVGLYREFVSPRVRAIHNSFNNDDRI
ncbi:hypothetical protein JW872_04020 [Candidatus Babeliales bacterium]|nr:hypothetical protein [Candidatus Babeliales bacterium]